jgi:hypothetical protein
MTHNLRAKRLFPCRSRLTFGDIEYEKEKNPNPNPWIDISSVHYYITNNASYSTIRLKRPHLFLDLWVGNIGGYRYRDSMHIQTPN